MSVCQGGRQRRTFERREFFSPFLPLKPTEIRKSEAILQEISPRRSGKHNLARCKPFLAGSNFRKPWSHQRFLLTRYHHNNRRRPPAIFRQRKEGRGEDRRKAASNSNRCSFVSSSGRGQFSGAKRSRGEDLIVAGASDDDRRRPWPSTIEKVISGRPKGQTYVVTSRIKIIFLQSEKVHVANARVYV